MAPLDGPLPRSPPRRSHPSRTRARSHTCSHPGWQGARQSTGGLSSRQRRGVFPSTSSAVSPSRSQGGFCGPRVVITAAPLTSAASRLVAASRRRGREAQPHRPRAAGGHLGCRRTPASARARWSPCSSLDQGGDARGRRWRDRERACRHEEGVGLRERSEQILKVLRRPQRRPMAPIRGSPGDASAGRACERPPPSSAATDA